MMCKAVLIGGLTGIAIGYWLKRIETLSYDLEGIAVEPYRVDAVNSVYSPKERKRNGRNNE